LKLLQWIVRKHELAFVWDASERGRFKEEYFPPIRIATVPHTPWVQRNIPIPPAIYDEVVKIIKDKIQGGVYEPSNAAYRSRWFCVVKKDGKSLRLVHDLQPLNAVTIKDAALPPFTDHLTEAFAGYAVYGMMDLYGGYDHRPLHPESRDLTTFGTPLGPHRLTTLPQGFANSAQIFQADTSFILQDEIPHHTIPFIDDLPVKSVNTRYQREDGSYETIPGNSGIRRFIWEHCEVVHRIIQRLENVGATISAKKFVLAAPTAVILGFKCTIDGRVPEESKTQKIQDWPECKTVTQVRGFLGTCGVLRIFIKDFSRIARPLIKLTKKDEPFEFGPEQQEAMQRLKDAVINSPALRRIDYECGREIILAVDTSNIAVGYILMQLGEDGKRYPSRFGSLTLNEVESRYSQAKLELYGLFRALRAVRVWIFGVRNLTIEVDAKYIKGMINNPDLQPNASINRWIAGILLFNFKLVHVPAAKHTGADGLSRRPPSEDDPEISEDHEDWLDSAYSFSIQLLNDHYIHPSLRLSNSPHTHFPTHSVFIDSVSNPPHPTIPRSDSAKAFDKRLITIREFLTTTTRPPDLSDSEFQSFVNYATKFFILGDKLWRRHPEGRHQLVIEEPKRYELIRQAHDDLGHKGVYTVRIRLLLRFWWPMLSEDVKWYIKTCHECQIRQTTKIHIPPTVPMPGGLFRKAHIDTMLMPKANGFRYLVQARCALTSYPEWRLLRSETATTLASFIFEDILCRWGPLTEIVTDNGPAFVSALEELASKYNIRHIRISPYNSQANGIVERRHYDVREAIMKSAEGDEAKWYKFVHSVFWAERVTILKSCGMSPYFMVHGVEPLFPFDITEATFLVPLPDQNEFSSTDLIAWRARQLQKRAEDIQDIEEKVLKARYASIKQFEASHKITDYDFEPGALVLVRNSRIEAELNRKTKPRYLGPMIVLRRTLGGSYLLAELDGSISRLRYAAFRLAPYHPRNNTRIPVTSITGLDEEDLDRIAGEDVEEPVDEDPESEHLPDPHIP
jgi:transposase InsO family protein